jgi:hypothetical protein
MPAISKSDLQKLASKSQLSALFQALTEVAESSDNAALRNEIILIEAKYTRLMEASRAGTIRYDDKTITEGQIVNSLVETISNLPKQPFEISDALHLKLKRQVRSGYYKYVLSALLTVVIIGIVAFVSFEKKESPKAASTPQELQPDTTIPSQANTPETKPVAMLRTIWSKTYPASNSQMVVNGSNYPLAYMDLAYMKGKEQEANTIEDACCYQFEIVNPNQEPVILQNLFVELTDYKPFPKSGRIITSQPFEEATVVYILMGKNTTPGSNVYRNLFYWVADKRKNWGKIKIAPKGTETITARINTKQPGIYTFQLGLEYFPTGNDSLVRTYVLPKPVTWVFKENPE